VSRAADIAASKGILVVNSAGNERNKYWIRIIAPADGDSVLTAGAVDGNNVISAFSSAGPSSDRQIKPDISTLGVSIVVQSSENQLSRSSGTSFSCPVLSGLAACLMEAVPDANNIEIIGALHSSADRYNYPDSLYGYGIPDMVKALDYLQDIYVPLPDNGPTAGPNPTRGEIEFIFREEPGNIIAEVVTSAGVTIYKKDFGDFAGRSLRLDALNNREQGIYFIRLFTATGTFRYKIVKLND
jgi:subtilisin family serine protease